MKIITIILVLFVYFTHIFCENLTSIIETSTRPSFLRSKYSRNHENNRNLTNHDKNLARNTTKLNIVESITSTSAIIENVTLDVTTFKPEVNNNFTVLVQNTTILPESSSVDETNLSYTGCGIRKNENHPWIAIIEHVPPKNMQTKLRVRKTLSKGVLIHPLYVLTTISSIHNSHPFWIVSSVRLGDKITLDVGDDNSTNFLNPITVPIEEVFLHRHKDIAIIKLAHKINVTDYIRPICLPIDQAYNYRELFIHLCKYRVFHRNIRERRVTTEPVSPISPQDCHILFTRKHSKISVETEFCAWDEIGDMCAGDIGGPLFVKIDSKNTIIGLKSMATSDREDLQEDTTIPGVYTRVGSYLKWISAIINFNE